MKQFGNSPSQFYIRGAGSSLTKLEFSQIYLGDEAAAEFISSMAYLQNLQELDVSINGIAAKACKSLAGMLCKPESKLKILKLGSNNIGDVEVEILSESLTQNTALEILALTNNNVVMSTTAMNSITEVGWGMISKVLRESNHTLKAVTDSEFPELKASDSFRKHHTYPDLQAVTSNELKYLLKMNSTDNKTIVAQQKSILFRHVIHIEFKPPLTDQMMLPLIISWINRKTPLEIKITSVFGLLKATTGLWNE